MAMKDVVNCENPRVVVSELRSGGIRMGQPGSVYTESCSTYFNEKINNEGMKELNLIFPDFIIHNL